MTITADNAAVRPETDRQKVLLVEMLVKGRRAILRRDPLSLVYVGQLERGRSLISYQFGRYEVFGLVARGHMRMVSETGKQWVYGLTGPGRRRAKEIKRHAPSGA